MMRFTLKSTVALEAIFRATHIMKQVWYSFVDSYMLDDILAPFLVLFARYGCASHMVVCLSNSSFNTYYILFFGL